MRNRGRSLGPSSPARKRVVTRRRDIGTGRHIH